MALPKKMKSQIRGSFSVTAVWSYSGVGGQHPGCQGCAPQGIPVTAMAQKNQHSQGNVGFSCSGGGIRTRDLRVMLTNYGFHR